MKLIFKEICITRNVFVFECFNIITNVFEQNEFYWCFIFFFYFFKHLYYNFSFLTFNCVWWLWYLEFEWYAVFPIGLSLYLYYNFALKFITKFIRWLVKAYSHSIMRKTHYSISSEVPALEDQLINFTHFLWSFNLHISKLFYYIVTWFYTTNRNPGGIKWAMFLKDS